MTNEEILQKALEKAQLSGYRFYVDENHPYYGEEQENVSALITIYRQIIFSHEFAKAFWGDDLLCTCKMGIGSDIHLSNCGRSAWQYHLQQMVLEPEPLQYLAKYLTI